MTPFLLAQAEAVPGYSYKYPFIQPLPLWDQWWWTLIPLVVLVCVAYKGVKCSYVREVPVEASKMTVFVLVGFVLAAIGVGLVVKGMAWYVG